MKKIFIITIIFFTFLLSSLFGQEQSFYRHYLISPTLINPGAVGFEKGVQELYGNYLSAWSGFKGTPSVFTLGYQGNFNKNAGFGALLMSETAGSINKFKAELMYAYKARLDNVEASFGINAGYLQKSLKNGVLNDPEIQIDDPVLLEANGGLKFFDLGLGIYTKINKTFTLSASFTNIVHENIGNKYKTNFDDPFKYAGITVFVGNRFKFKNTDFDLEPSVCIRKVGADAPLLYDINLMGYFLDSKLMGGVSFLSAADQLGASVLMGIVFNKVKLAYSYDILTGDFQAYNNGKHEFTVIVGIGKIKS